MCRHGHDSPGAVSHQHVVCNPDGYLLVVDRVDGVCTCKDSGLILGEVSAVKVRLERCGSEILLNLIFLFRGGKLLHKGVFRRQYHVCCPEKRIGTCGVDCNLLLTSIDIEIDFGTGGATDPVTLHLLDPFGPVEVFEAAEKPFGVVGNT